MGDEILIKTKEFKSNYILISIKNIIRRLKVKVYLTKLKKKKANDSKIKKYKYLISLNNALIKLDNSYVLAERKANLYEKEYGLFIKNTNQKDSLLLENDRRKLENLLKEVYDSYNDTITAKREYDILRNSK